MSPILSQIPGKTGFVHLHVHGYYSFFDSTMAPADIVTLALVSGAGAVAMTDTNCLSGAVVFYKAAREAGLNPIIGTEVRQTLDEERDLLRAREKHPNARAFASSAAALVHCAQGDIFGGDDDSEGSNEPGGSASPSLCQGDIAKRAVLLARNFAGYSEISHIVTRRMLDPDFDLFAEVQKLSDNVVMLSDCPQVLAAAAPTTTHLYAELIPSRTRRRQNRAVYDCAHKLALPLVVGCDVKMAAPADAPLHNLLQAMRRLSTIYRLPESDHIDPAQHFQSEEVIRGFFGVLPDSRRTSCSPMQAELNEALANTVRIADMCHCEIPLGEWKFLRFDGLRESPQAMLRELVTRGLRDRYGNPPAEAAVERMDYELSVIEKLQFTEYFLLVNRIVEEAHSRGYYTVGRGSAANSIVSYSLKLTNVCPLRYNLYFERFLNPERNSPPDIDIDFSWKERDDVIRWCFDYFGYDKVALISTIQTLQKRQAIREVAKAHGISENEVTALNRLHETGFAMEQDDAGTSRDGVETHSMIDAEPWRTILAQASRISDFPRHLSIHCGGIIVAPKNVVDYVPLTRSAKGFVITQMDMYSVEDLGLIKIDLLSNRSIGVLKDSLQNADQNRELYADSVDAAGAATTNTGTMNAEIFQREAQRIKLAGTRRGTSVALAGIFGMNSKTETAQVPICTAGDAPQHVAQDDGESRDPCVALVKKRVFDFEYITNDAATRAMIDSGRTMGCFYIESPGMRALFERLRCQNFEEVVTASSIIRPGVAESGMMQEYITRHQQLEGKGTTPPHPLMLKVLPETHGVMVYQEDVLKVAHEVAGMTLGQADLLRRAMSGKMRSADAMARIEEQFFTGAAKNGLTDDEAQEIWRQMSSFAGYSFCKGHSAAFAVLSYQIAYLKAHYPAEFFAAVLSNGGGFYGAGAYLGEARRSGLRVKLPCINESDEEYTGRTTGVRGDDGVVKEIGWVRIGLMAVSGLSDRTVQRTIRERQRSGVYRSLADFAVRTRAGLEECRTLIKVGAMDSIAPPDLKPAQTRPIMLLEAECYFREREMNSGTLLDAISDDSMCAESLVPPGANLAPFTGLDICRMETEIMGFMISAHPLDLVAPRGRKLLAGSQRLPLVPGRDIRKYRNRRVRMIGTVIAVKRLAAKNTGQTMKMLTLEDRSDTFEAILFPRVYQKYAARTVGYGPFLVEGKVDMMLGSPTLNVEHIEVLRGSK